MPKKKLLIAGGGYADIPLILAAKKLGFFVITSGNRSEDMGHKYADKVRLGDFSDFNEMLKIATEEKIDAICPCCNDFSALSSAFVAEKLNLPGHDPLKTSEIIHHKDNYRKFALENGINAPKAYGCSNMDEALSKLKLLNLPIIVKPVDLTGGKGISVIDDYSKGLDAIKYAFERSKAKRIVIEEFINGTRHGFSSFLINKKIKFYFTDNEYYYMNPYLVSAASAPGVVPESAIKKLIYESELIAQKLNLKDGIFHIQFILKDEIPYIIEICRRAPGDLYIKLVEYATGIDYSSYIVKSFVGLDCSDIEYKEINGYFTRHCIMTNKNGILENIIYDESIKKNIFDEFLFWKKGDIVEDYMVKKFGISFLKFDSMEEMLEKTNKLQELIKPIVI